MAFGVFSVWIVGVASMFSCLGSNNDENDTDHFTVERMLLRLFCFFLECSLVMMVAAKCDKHCELHDSMDHQKFEIMLLFPVLFEIMFSECHCLCFGVCVDGFNMDVLVRVHGCVSLHFPSFYFSCFCFCDFFSHFVWSFPFFVFFSSVILFS